MVSSILSRRLDFGWLSVLAGLAVCSLALLLPAQEGLAKARVQLDVLHAQEAWLTSRLIAYDRFLQDMERQDPDFIQRLAASQLNLIPSGQTPVLQDVTAGEASIEAWIESTVAPPMQHAHQPAASALGSLTRGSFRTLFLAFGIMCIFFGLLTSLPHRARVCSPSA
jgi:hypothetical protein